MEGQYMSLENLKYTLFEVHELSQLLSYQRFEEFDMEAFDMLLNSMEDFADKELYPYYRAMDEKPAYFKEGKIIVHPQFEKIIPQGAELGLVGATFDYENHGMQLPESVFTAAYFILEAANNHASNYLGLTSGAADLIAHFASQELKDTYLPAMMSGKWNGTMCLTEPQAGSSLSDVMTSAIPTASGSYKIKGQKIFISGGDHAYAENFVHLVLARIAGAPAGTKGISLFVVPKKRPSESGLVPNDVSTAGDFQKMGQRGYCTAHLVFGDQDECEGYLVGEANQGLKYMFLMMNHARLAVGRGAIAISTAAYFASLAYAKERPQGRRLSNTGAKDVSQEQTLIINHPDVRRMLFLQKAIAEGSLSLLLQTVMYYDLEKVVQTPEEKEKYQLLVEILTPVVKTYPSEMGMVSTNNGLQILGGYGFCSEFILQQYVRDIRIFSIYEGTTGIQSLDLLGRKISMKNGKALQLLAAEITASIQEAMEHPNLKPYAAVLASKLQLSQQVLGFLLPFAKKGQYERFLSDATAFMEFFGILVMAWQWLKLATHAQRALEKGDKAHTAAFYEAKIHTMKFYFKYEVPKTNGLSEILTHEEVLTLADDTANLL